MMTVQDFWSLSPEISMALLALVVVAVDLVTRSMAKVSAIALVGLIAPLVLTLNLWFGWFGDPAAGAPGIATLRIILAAILLLARRCSGRSKQTGSRYFSTFC